MEGMDMKGSIQPAAFLKRSHEKRNQVNKPGFYHLYARTVDGGRLFYRQSDFKKLLTVMEDARKRFDGTRIIIVVCMSNHFHLVAYSPDVMGFKTFVCRKYCGWYNLKYSRRGPLLEDSSIKASQLPYREAIRDKILYNANNPVKAKLCKTAFGYKYSSLRSLTLRPWVWKTHITIDSEYIISMFGSVENLKQALLKEVDYKSILKKSYEREGPPQWLEGVFSDEAL